MTTQDLEKFREDVRKDYWDAFKDAEPKDEKRWQCYIEKILPEEFRLAREDPLSGGTTRLPEAPREVLVLLVGFQIEPLLQAVCAWKPEKVVLVLNQYYGKKETGQDWGDFVAKKIIQSAQHGGTTLPAIGQLVLNEAETLPSAQPANVFRCLRIKHIQWSDTENASQQTIAELALCHGREQIIFDITGGKKSMVAGAYLFCAYAGLHVSYVDFDDDAYEPKYGKPYGHACQIGVMENPYQLFGLRDWQRVEELYRSNAFKAAREEVERLLPQMEGGYFTNREIEAARKLQSTLHVYELWDRGDHHEANEQSKTLVWFQRPKVIGALCSETPTWPNVISSSGGSEAAALNINAQVVTLAIGPRADLTDSFYQQSRLVHYAEDELARAERLRTRGEYRTAYLRAYAVYEVLTKARLVQQLVRGEFERTDLSPPVGLASLSSSEKQRVTNMVRRFSDLGEMVKALSDDSHSLAKNRIRLQAKNTAQIMEKFWLDSIGHLSPDHPLTEDTMTELRNQVAHFCLWIPNDLAEACLKCARANLDDFKKNWVTETTNPKEYEPLDWEELCQQCGLKFLPPTQRLPKNKEL